MFHARFYSLLVALLLCCAWTSAQTFMATEIPDSVFAKMQGKSYGKGCTMSRDELRYLRLSYWNMENESCVGEMVCNRLIAEDLVEIFRELYSAHYRIGRMQLVDDFDATDEISMRANNTSCFNFRFVSGSRTVSKHGKGMAVDINPLYNPCVYVREGKTKVEPATAQRWAKNRENRKDIPCKIDHSDLCYKLFVKHGFRWGGDWKTKKDYQHFEK